MIMPKKERLMTPEQVLHVFGRVIKDCNVYEVVKLAGVQDVGAFQVIQVIMDFYPDFGCFENNRFFQIFTHFKLL